MSNNFIVIVLKYSIKSEIAFQKCADFLDTAGVYTWGCCTLYKNPISLKAINCKILDVDDMVQKAAADTEWNSLYKIPYEELECGMENGSPMKQLLESFDCLNKIYEQYDLFHASATLQYYRSNPALVDDAGERFLHAADALEQLVSKNESLKQNRHIRYAILYCKQKVNLARILCEKPLCEFADVLAGYCHQLAAEFEGFSNAVVLKGLMYENLKEFADDAASCFQRALKDVGVYPFASSIYYSMGKCYEDIGRTNEMEKAYRKGHELNPGYQLIYKMAIISEINNDGLAAVGYYEECMEYLDKKEGYLNPLEQEYYFKGALRAAYDCLILTEEAERALVFLCKAERLRDYVEDGLSEENKYTGYYYDFYASDAPKYIRISLAKMNQAKMYQYYTGVYEMLGDTDEARRYFTLYDKERQIQE